MSEQIEETLTAIADRLAREAVKKEVARHSPVIIRHSQTGETTAVYCSYCVDGVDGIVMASRPWPCPTIEALDEAWEAINVAEEEEVRIANGPYFCGVQTRGQRYVDPEPAEFCMNEVENEDDVCAKHEEPDDDDYDRWKESRYDD